MFPYFLEEIQKDFIKPANLWTQELDFRRKEPIIKPVDPTFTFCFVIVMPYSLATEFRIVSVTTSLRCH